MAGDKYVGLNAAGSLEQVEAKDVSAGAGDAGKIGALDSTGRWSNTMMPVGIGADTASIISSENLTAGDYVAVYDNTAVPNVRKADATVIGKLCDGFVLASTTSPAVALVYFEGVNDQVTGMTIGSSVFLQTTAGLGGDTVPSVAGNVVQKIGRAISATAVSFERAAGIILA